MWVGGGGVESEFSDRFGYSLALAKPNKILECVNSIACELSSFTAIEEHPILN